MPSLLPCLPYRNTTCNTFDTHILYTVCLRLRSRSSQNNNNICVRKLLPSICFSSTDLFNVLLWWALPFESLYHHHYHHRHHHSFVVVVVIKWCCLHFAVRSFVQFTYVREKFVHVQSALVFGFTVYTVENETSFRCFSMWSQLKACGFFCHSGYFHIGLNDIFHFSEHFTKENKLFRCDGVYIHFVIWHFSKQLSKRKSKNHSKRYA